MVTLRDSEEFYNSADAARLADAYRNENPGRKIQENDKSKKNIDNGFLLFLLLLLASKVFNI